jgi:hypothetical protein
MSDLEEVNEFFKLDRDIQARELQDTRALKARTRQRRGTYHYTLNSQTGCKKIF